MAKVIDLTEYRQQRRAKIAAAAMEADIELPMEAYPWSGLSHDFTAEAVTFDPQQPTT